MLSQVDLYGSKPHACAPQHGGNLCIWLQQRAEMVNSITFHRFRVRLRRAMLHHSALLRRCMSGETLLRNVHAYDTTFCPCRTNMRF
jgi:hypothetical protein